MTKIDKTDILKKDLLVALEKSLGVVSTACEKVGCCRQSFYDYYKEDEEFRRHVDEIKEYALDFAESKLMELVSEKHPAALMFFLKCKGKKRGYIENQNIDLTTNGKGLITTIEIVDKTGLL